ncbi:hypothetical protein K435DRAFT_795869 [Dendrothele bispora CBS 962.96]|uniref:Uncharacterized protein n=1 Tax=Dendrothele bispora (strain CBS 962.96) TaxID=1314807 RepID=A0A4S8M8N7_DENBC|nr:hypothetical protein K435DRAFT_795869 [Dendrothele bispora CBS 962.96]
MCKAICSKTSIIGTYMIIREPDVPQDIAILGPISLIDPGDRINAILSAEMFWKVSDPGEELGKDGSRQPGVLDAHDEVLLSNDYESCLGNPVSPLFATTNSAHQVFIELWNRWFYDSEADLNHKTAYVYTDSDSDSNDRKRQEIFMRVPHNEDVSVFSQREPVEMLFTPTKSYALFETECKQARTWVLVGSASITLKKDDDGNCSKELTIEVMIGMDVISATDGDWISSVKIHWYCLLIPDGAARVNREWETRSNSRWLGPRNFGFYVHDKTLIRALVLGENVETKDLDLETCLVVWRQKLYTSPAEYDQILQRPILRIAIVSLASDLYPDDMRRYSLYLFRFDFVRLFGCNVNGDLNALVRCLMVETFMGKTLFGMDPETTLEDRETGLKLSADLKFEI